MTSKSEQLLLISQHQQEFVRRPLYQITDMAMNNCPEDCTCGITDKETNQEFVDKMNASLDTIREAVGTYLVALEAQVRLAIENHEAQSSHQGKEHKEQLPLL